MAALLGASHRLRPRRPDNGGVDFSPRRRHDEQYRERKHDLRHQHRIIDQLEWVLFNVVRNELLGFEIDFVLVSTDEGSFHQSA